MKTNKKKGSEMTLKEKEELFGVMDEYIEDASAGDSEHPDYIYQKLKEKLSYVSGKTEREIEVIISAGFEEDKELLHKLMKNI